MSRRTLLGVWAHPDDEAYLSAGLMAEFRDRGDRVVVVTATLGEHGTSDPQTWPPERLAPRRRVELRDALAAVGVSESHLLGYEDGRCDEVDATEVIASHMVALAPDVIVTFGPDGMTGHPDHIAVSRWTTDAWASARPNADLWYATVTPEFHDRWGAVNDEIGLFSEQPAPPCTDRTDLAHHRELTGSILDRKMRALRAHASQTEGLRSLLGDRAYRKWWAVEAFRPPTSVEAGRVRITTGSRGC